MNSGLKPFSGSSQSSLDSRCLRIQCGMSVLCQCACVCVCLGMLVLGHSWRYGWPACTCISTALSHRDQARGLAGTFMHIATCHGRNHTRWTEPRVVSYNIDGGGGWSQLGHRRQEALTNDMKKLCEQEAHVAKGGIVRACTTVQLCH
jgi:hypothetical protein